MKESVAVLLINESLVEGVRAAVSIIPGGAGMFTTGVSPSGEFPATHYISSGTLSMDLILVSSSHGAIVYIDRDPYEVLSDLNLSICREELPI